VEIHCRCDIAICEERDPKGLYKKARAGEIKDFTGVDAPYEEPPHAEVVVNTDSETVEESAEKVLQYLEEHQIIPPAG
jgi:adenylylsulfate kinase